MHVVWGSQPILFMGGCPHLLAPIVAWALLGCVCPNDLAFFSTLPPRRALRVGALAFWGYKTVYKGGLFAVRTERHVYLQ